MSLSPLTLANMREQQRRLADTNERPTEKRITRIEPTYICPVCGYHHDWEDDAIECCAPEDDEESGDGQSIPADVCPVCARDHFGDSHSAANCCLWKDTTPLQRFLIASRVERGEDWVDAINACMASEGETT